MRTKLIPFLFIGVLLGLSRGQTRSAKHRGIPQDTRITLRRSDCFLQCPDYLVTITADGRVTFEGYANVRVKQKVQSQITAEQMESLVAAIQKAKYFSLRDKYGGKEDGCRHIWPDSDSATISVLMNGKSKSIDHYLGCSSGGQTSYPKALTKLEDLIDEVTNTKQWID